MFIFYSGVLNSYQILSSKNEDVVDLYNANLYNRVSIYWSFFISLFSFFFLFFYLLFFHFIFIAVMQIIINNDNYMQ